MLKKLMMVVMLGSPAVTLAAPYLLLGGATGKADTGDMELAVGPAATLNTDDGFGRALIGGGAELTPNLALEALYLTPAEVAVTDSATGRKDTLESAGVQLAALVKAPLAPGFAVFGKLSGNYMDMKYSSRAPLGTSFSDKDSQFQLGFGAGLEFMFNDDAGLRLTAERIQLRDAVSGGGDAGLDQATLAVVLNF